MALISAFERRPLQPRSVHGEVLCGYAVVDVDGRRILQLETYGSPDRAMPEKVSQSIQLDSESAKTLATILREAFGA